MSYRHLYDNDKERIKAMNVLAGHQLNLQEAEKDEDKRKQFNSRGYNLINQATNIQLVDPNNWISKCFYTIVTG